MSDRPVALVTSPARPASSPLLALATGAALAGLATLVVAPIGARSGLWGAATGGLLLGAAGVLGVLAAGLAFGAWRRSASLGRALAVVLAGFAVAAVPLRAAAISWGAPAIHDVTTDLDNPPRYVAVARLRTAAANAVVYGGPDVARQQRAAYADLRPLLVTASPRRALALAADTAKAEGWTVLAQDLGFGDLGRLEASDTTFWFGRIDDVVVRIVPHAVGSRVDVRSSARDDAADGGRNARRIRRFLAYLAERARAEPAGADGR